MNDADSPNIVWVTIDSIRADRTTLGGYHRRTTPNMERIAESSGGDWFGNCISQTRWTPASTSSILTGTYLSTHQVGITSPDVEKLRPELRTAPELLSDRGYRSFGASTNQYFCSATDLDRGFDRFIFPTARNLHRTVGLPAMVDYLRNITRYGPGLSTDLRSRNAVSMVAYAAKRWMRDVASDGDPFFTYIHFNKTHYPYNPPPYFLKPFAEEIGIPVETIMDHSDDIFEDVFGRVADGLPLTGEEWASIEAAYDAELAYVDHIVGELFDYVRSEIDDDVIFVVTADHGEAFGEHGWIGHHVIVSDELVHVPLVVHGLPEISDQRDELVQHVDLMRTILEYAGCSSSQFEGINLADDTRSHALVQRAPRENDREKLLDRNGDFETDLYRWDAVNCIQDKRFKLVTGEEGDELFELPDEETNVIDEYPDVAAELAAKLEEQLPRFAVKGRGGERAEFDDAMYQRLSDMGYL